MRLGLASLAPAVVAVMVAIAIWRYDQRLQLGQERAGANILLAQGRAIVYFALFYVWAICVRRTDPETHKRMMLLATVVLPTW